MLVGFKAGELIVFRTQTWDKKFFPEEEKKEWDNLVS